MHRLAIDIGTTQIKFNLFFENEIISSQKTPVETYYKKGGKVYQKPDEILDSIKQMIKQLTKENQMIEEIYFSTAMHSIMPVFNEGRNQELYIWLDQRPSEWIKSFKQDQEQATLFYQKTGTPIHEMSPFAKIGYFKEEDWFDEVDRWIGIKEYLMKSFTGQEVVDYSVASATGLFNSEELIWDKNILAFLTLDEKKLPQTVDTDWSTKITASLAKELGLSESVTIFVGASDGCLASLGSFVANGTVNTLTLGTSGAVRKLSKTRQLDKAGQSFCYYITKDYWVTGGATNNGGKVLEWASEMLYEESSIFNQLDHILSSSPIGSRGVQFIPYISGERAPLWSRDVRGSFHGLRLGHQKEDMLRSVIEGVLLNTRWIADIIQLEKKTVSLSGGFFDNPLLVELAADVLGRNCIMSPFSEPSFGLLCLVELNKTNRSSNGESIFYNEMNHQAYETVYERFLETVKNEL